MILCTARVAPEKAVFRPALPMCSSPGISEMQMQPDNALPLGGFIDIAHGAPLKAWLVLDLGKQPVVHLTGGNPGASYNLTEFLAVAPSCMEFRSVGGFVDDPIYTLSSQDVQSIAEHALKCVRPADGHFEIRWVPNDPKLPF